MGKFTATHKLNDTQNVTYTAHKPSTDHCGRVIEIRLRAATSLAIDPDASIAWVERKVIRDRMRYYTTTHNKVIN